MKSLPPFHVCLASITLTLFSAVDALGTDLQDLTFAVTTASATEKITNVAATVSETTQITDVQVGLAGRYKVGFWIPIHLTIDGGKQGFRGQVEFRAPDSDDLTTRFVAAATNELQVDPNEQWSGWRYVKLGRIRAKLEVVLRASDGGIAGRKMMSELTPAPSTWQWVVTIGSDVGARDAAAFLSREQSERIITNELTSPAEFPDRWFGYEGVSVFVVATSKQKLLEELNEVQFAALVRWLRLGGRLVLSAGQRVEEIFAPGHRFHIFRPGEFAELDLYWKGSGLENYARAIERLQSDDVSPLATYTDMRGRVICFEGAGGTDDRAIVSQYPLGFGSITYLALDLDQPAIASWPARPRLVARLLQSRSDDEELAIGTESMGRVTHVGYEDLSGQLRAALDQFPGVTLVQFSWVAGLLALYILLIGPVDYFVLQRFGRPHWTWVTFPLTVLLFCAIAYWLSQHWKGERLQVNQVDLVDIDLTEQLVRGTSWFDLYSRDTASLQLGLQPLPSWPVAGDDAAEVLASWQGLPGKGLGGMNTTATVDVLGDEYEIRYPLTAQTEPTQHQITDLPIPTSSTKSLMARWATTTTLKNSAQLTANHLDLLEGTVTNPLDVKLTRCQVLYANWAYMLDRALPPGDSARLGGKQPLDLQWRLTRRSVIGSEEVGSTWQRGNVSDMDRILEMMMFHGAAGGQAFTGLSHSYQPYVDLSRHLRNGRAILVGRCEQAATVLNVQETKTSDAQSGRRDKSEQNGKDQRWTYYRIVLPVTIEVKQ